MWICHHWMQEEMTNRRGRSHLPRCTTDWWIVRMEMMDRAAISRTIAQQIQSVTHHSVSACTIRRRLQHSGISAKLPWLLLPLTGNHRCLCRQWFDKRWT
ncbi:transposable element Tcb1 transposase [Trichonephila clavipes]|nr:transposable element Tcb1 transposase [Trichonephila clavipes]